jgi:hypothetical protein
MRGGFLRERSRAGAVRSARHNRVSMKRREERAEKRVRRVGRNDPCPCGSGRKAKRCCGVPSGPGEESLGRAYLAEQVRSVVPTLLTIPELETKRLLRELPDLPALDLSLVLRLPGLLTPELGRLLDAVADEDEIAFDDAIDAALAQVDTVANRVALARAVVALRDAGRIEPRLAAIALVDLERTQGVLSASLIEAAAIATGQTRTPGGLLVAAA